MGLPRKLKDLMLFNAGIAYVGEVSSVTLPKLSRKLEAYRGGGMDAEVKVDLGQEAMEMEFTCGGLMLDVLRQFGVMTAAGVMLRFAGAYQRDDSGAVDKVEVIVRGRHEEIDMGEAKGGEDTEFKVKSSLAYYKLVVNGRTEIEIDPINMVLIVGGVDRLAERRAALGI
jgi:P2 family phage contractile tail tube protein